MSAITWVAECGSMHKGSPALAYEMIRRFAEAGATICKFQFGWNRFAQSKANHPYDKVRYVDHLAEDLARWCDDFGVELMASIWSLEGLETARKVGMKRYKIAASVWREWMMYGHYKDELIAMQSDDEGLGTYEKPVYISSDTPGYQSHATNATNIYCVSKYPAFPEDIDMPNHFNTGDFPYYGYSDHAHGIEACLLAVARGAEYIEKHVCLDKTDLVTRDTPFSATPEEFEQMVKIGNQMRRLLDAGN